MGDRFPGGVISKTPPTVVAPVDGEGGSASGVWTLAEQLGLQKAGNWPQKVLPRELYAWGDNSPNGQIGDGTTVDRSSPVQIGSLTNWEQFASGRYHCASVKTDGTLWTWGFGSAGVLGSGDTISRSSPVQVGALTDWNTLSAGPYHTVAVKTNGTLWSWGSANSGRLGDGTVVYKSSPVQIGALTNWSQTASGSAHNVSVTTDGELYAWGLNSYGQLGDNTVASKSSPVQVGALTTWSQVSAAIGGNFTAAIKTDNTLWTWGQNNYGNLGIGTASGTNKSSPVQIGALTTWAQVSLGRFHSIAVTTSGALYAWGRAITDGALGDNTVDNKSSPVQIGALTNWSQVSAGSYHTAAVKTDGTLWAWGRGTNGRLGDGTVDNKSSPVQIGALTDWLRTAGGENNTLALTRG